LAINWPPSVHDRGPCCFPDRPQWLSVDRPVVLVTTSSEFQDDGRLVRTALEASAGERYLVVATLPAGDPGDHRVPDNARLERFLPHDHVLERAVCAVTHGGMGATQKALTHGVPVCVVPFGCDQFEVARREVAGAGTRLPVSQLNADRLRAAVRAAVARRDGARRIAAAFAAAGGPPAAADAVEKSLSGAHKGS
jgi:MGT family glycosyltransferase